MVAKKKRELTGSPEARMKERSPNMRGFRCISVATVHIFWIQALSVPAQGQVVQSSAALERRIEVLESRLQRMEQSSDRSQGSPDAVNVDELDQRLKILDRRWELAEEAATDRTSSISRRLDTLEKSTPKADKDGWVDLSTEKWTVKLGGHVQMDLINWPHADPAITGAAAAPGTKDYFEFRRLRLVADGTGYGVFDFRLQMTLEPETVGESPAGTVTSPDIKDAYLSMNQIPYLGRFRIGNFFVPFSLEQVTNDTNNIFLERSIPTQGIFAADREVGVAFYNATADQNFTWSYGAFLDSISEGLKERIDDNQGIRVSGRVTWLPYYDEPSNGRYLVHTGLGILYTSDQNDSVRFRARPQIHEGPRLIDSGALAADAYTTGNLEFAVVWGPIAIQSEAFLSNVDMLSGDSVNVYGAYVHASYFLTGENRIYERFGQHGAQFGRNAPYTNFFLVPGCHGWGAWELKARTSYLALNEVDRGRYNDLTVGVNWYWSDRIRVMFDWIHPWTNEETTFGSTQSDILAMRFDFSW
jgi:phosphate-selective porin OprO/OprP